MKSSILAVALVACAARPVAYTGEPPLVRSATLVKLDPEVQVVADADKPMFFADGAYWMFYDAHWYRGASVSGPWMLERTLPWQVKKIDQPYAFVRYRHEHPAQTAQEQSAPAQPQPPKRSKMFEF
jgi:hypothetical protein